MNKSKFPKELQGLVKIVQREKILRNFQELTEFRLKKLQQQRTIQKNTIIAAILSCDRKLKILACELYCEAYKECEKE